jgi:hypothetical protein
LDQDHVGFHEWVAYRRDSIEDLFGSGGTWAWKRSDEVDQGIWSLSTLVDTLEP